MSVGRFACSAFVVVLVACGGSVAPSPPDPAPSGSASGGGVAGGSASGMIGPDTIVGRAIALEEVAGGVTYERFDLDLVPVPAPQDPCSGAIARTRSCCAFPPARPPPTQPPGDGGTGTTTTPAESNAGTVSLTDATTNASLGTFEYERGAYTDAPANWTEAIWNPGDTLRLQAAGAELGPFSVSAPALAIATVALPSSISRTRDLAITWTPDPNAQSFVLSLGGPNGRTVACFAADAAGALTVDASMLATFDASTRVQGVAERSATQYARTPAGRIAFEIFSWQTLDATLE
ncbi:MAG TPA: hypothetical protein VIF62_07115 [Labilithrix sp.]